MRACAVGWPRLAADPPSHRTLICRTSTNNAAPIQCSGGYTVQNLPYLGGSPYDQAPYTHL